MPAARAQFFGGGVWQDGFLELRKFADEEQAFEVLREVLGERCRLGLDGSASKMLRIVLDRDTDSVMTPAHFIVHFDTRRRDVERSLSCLHCRAVSTRYRVLAHAMVC